MPVVPFTPRKRQRRDAVIEIREVEHEVLHPERRALADGRGLRRLEMRVAERRLVRATRARTSPSAREHVDDLRAQQLQRRRACRIRSALSVTYALVAPRWMNGRAAGRDVAERVHVRHHVVPEALS